MLPHEGGDRALLHVAVEKSFGAFHHLVYSLVLGLVDSIGKFGFVVHPIAERIVSDSRKFGCPHPTDSSP
jgi:hypothetical protein